MMNKTMNNEKGFVLIATILILLILLIIGIAATNTTIFELQISGNDRVAKEVFYAAEGGLQVGSELVEQSIWDFPSAVLVSDGTVASLGALSIVGDYTLLHAKPYFVPDSIDLDNPDAYFSYTGITPTPTINPTTTPRTDLWIGGQPVQIAGGSLQQLSGYVGKGKGKAGGGGGTLYDIHSRAYGPGNSQSWLLIQWLHVM